MMCYGNLPARRCFRRRASSGKQSMRKISDKKVRIVADRPVTIVKADYDPRWFPFVFRTTDGMLLLYIEYGHDANFTPFFRLESRDNGATWLNPTDNVPR